MATLTLDVLGMCVVLREGADGPWALGFFDDPGHLQTLHYQDAEGARVASLTFLGGRHLRFTGAEVGPVGVYDPERRLPLLSDVVPETCETLNKADVLAAFRSIIELPSGTLTPLSSHVSDLSSQWAFDGGTGKFCLTDRLRLTMRFNGVLQLGSQELSLGSDAYVTITSIDRDYGGRKQYPGEGFALTEFANFYRCTRQPGPIPRNRPVKSLDPDSPICPIVQVQY